VKVAFNYRSVVHEGNRVIQVLLIHIHQLHPCTMHAHIMVIIDIIQIEELSMTYKEISISYNMIHTLR